MKTSTAVILATMAVATQASSVNTTLPEVCFNPVGECDYYIQCVEEVNPCGSDGYAIGYGMKFCNLFTEDEDNFSDRGKAWIGAVRECLQVALIPEVEYALAGQPSTCGQIQDYAFESHVKCYTDPLDNSDRSMSVCTLPLTDWIKLLWTIRSSFTQAFVATIDQAVSTLIECGTYLIPDWLDLSNDADLAALNHLAHTNPEAFESTEGIARSLTEYRRTRQ